MAILLYIFSLNMKLSLWFVQHFSFFIKNINFFPQKSLDFMFPYLKWSLWDQNPKKFILSAEHCAPLLPIHSGLWILTVLMFTIILLGTSNLHFNDSVWYYLTKYKNTSTYYLVNSTMSWPITMSTRVFLTSYIQFQHHPRSLDIWDWGLLGK